MISFNFISNLVKDPKPFNKVITLILNILVPVQYFLVSFLQSHNYFDYRKLEYSIFADIFVLIWNETFLFYHNEWSLRINYCQALLEYHVVHNHKRYIDATFLSRFAKMKHWFIDCLKNAETNCNIDLSIVKECRIKLQYCGFSMIATSIRSVTLNNLWLFVELKSEE